MKKQIHNLLIISILAGFICFGNTEGFGEDPAEAEKPGAQAEQPEGWWVNLPNSILTIGDEMVTVRPGANPLRNAYFGDLHVHTTYSFDAFVFGTLATPDDAYRFAQGEAIKHPGGFDIQLREPLDFYAVTDHAEFLGIMPAAADPSTAVSQYDIYEHLHDMNASVGTSRKYYPKTIQGILDGVGVMERLQAFSTFFPTTVEGVQDGSLDKEMTLDVTRSAWADIIEAAEKHNNPGRFTTFIGYEYTTFSDDRGNLHRNVFFKGGDKIPAIPFGRYHSQNPEGLWDWMDGLREQGIETLAIPHNSNGSNGQMFKLTDWAGNPMGDNYVDQRTRNEPLVEITQIKGCSDTHPALSPNDEWADFEIMPFRVATQLPSEPLGSYVRTALRRGIALEEKDGINPYKYGFIGSSDTHTGATSDDESNYFGKIGLMDKNAMMRGSVPMPGLQAWAFRRGGGEDRMVTLGDATYIKGASETFATAGLAGVWAEENTREAIYNAFRRKETFATTGPRIRVRFFAGFDFDDSILDDKDMVAKAYASGVHMGGDLLAREGATPKFLVWVMRDPQSAPLQRVQIIKGWVAEGEPYEEVYDIACSDGLVVDPITQRCPDNGARVNLEDCSITADVGDAELKALWTDPDFDPGQRAFYYVRVLENPTCRWSTWDAVRAGVEPRPGLKKTIQERAWSSPIWYTP
jgi:hypothetical protein